MSGGLHAWMTAKRPRSTPPRARARRVFQAVAANEYAYSADETQLAAAGRVRPVLVQLNAFDDLVPRVALALRADHGDPVASAGERLALQPHPPVERHRKVLDDDQDSRRMGGSSHIQ